jgi:exodeoxyribonuclease III
MPLFSVATWNVNSIKVLAEHAAEWLRDRRPDVLALQELKTVSEEFPAGAFSAAGYHPEVHGQKTYNGVALLSRTPLEGVGRGIPELQDDPQARIISGRLPAGALGQKDPVDVINLYVPNGESPVSEKFTYKLRWLEALARHLQSSYRPDQPLLLVGDFNIAPGDLDVHDPAVFAGQVLFTDDEHAALQRLLDWGLTDLFRQLRGSERLFSWWDYRMNAFRRNLGARIDLVLATEPLARAAVSCEIDPGPRKRERPSDHTPVMAVFDLPGV